jgi:vacuolar-type H+-ATPase subunit H
LDLLYLLEQLEDVLAAGSHVPLTSRILVDDQELLDIIDQMRVSMPDEIKAARRLTEERDKIIADARIEADRTVGEARDEAEQILRDADARAAERLSEHHLVRAAQDRAADIEDRAMRQAADIRREADAYAYRVLQKLREQIGQVAQTVDRGIDELDARRVDDPEGAAFRFQARAGD